MRPLIFLFLFITMFTYADTGEDFSVKGAGATKCSYFIEETQRDSDNIKLFAGWVEGYLTATNMHSRGTYDVTSFQSTNLMLTLVNGYCKKNPDDYFLTAINKLILQFGNTRLKEKSDRLVLKNENKVAIVYKKTLEMAKGKLNQLGYKMSNGSDFIASDVKNVLRYQAKQGLALTGLLDEKTLLHLFY